MSRDVASPIRVSLRKLLLRIHRDEGGAVSLETILVVGVIALPILIFLIKYGWPRIKTYFNTGMTNLESGANNAQNNN
jgi:Flp pilus assembly pilin Flp